MDEYDKNWIAKMMATTTVLEDAVLKIVMPSGIQYEGETFEQMEERERQAAEHNAAVERDLQAWKPGPAKFYRKWCEKYAPQLLD
jgi:hypothetical protein